MSWLWLTVMLTRVQLHAGAGMIARDDVNEKQNGWHKKMRKSQDVKTLVQKSVFLGWLRRCKATRDATMVVPDKSKKKSIAPKRTAELQVCCFKIMAAIFEQYIV